MTRSPVTALNTPTSLVVLFEKHHCSITSSYSLLPMERTALLNQSLALMKAQNL
jgi:hypothetical protein